MCSRNILQTSPISGGSLLSPWRLVQSIMGKKTTAMGVTAYRDRFPLEVVQFKAPPAPSISVTDVITPPASLQKEEQIVPSSHFLTVAAQLMDL